jgi:hypothetical protein
LIKRIPDTTSSDPMDLLQQLKQLSSVNAYIDSCEAWMTQMKRERTYSVQEFFVDRFISGLNEGVKHHVQCQKPNSLLSAYWYARQYEKAYLSANKRIQAPALAPRQQANIPARQLQGPSAQQALAREFCNRPPRKCWYCPNNWTIGHKCQPMQRALNQIEMQGHSDEEDDFPLPQPAAPEVIPVPVI